MTKFEIVAQAAGYRDALRFFAAKVKQFGVDVAVSELSCESTESAASIVSSEIDWWWTIEGSDYWMALHHQLELREHPYDRDKYTARAEYEERRWIVRCIAPTHYQIEPATRLMGVSPVRYGHRNYIADSQVFDTEEEAEQWLLGRAEHLFFHERLDEEEYMGSHKQILEYGRMTYDGATAIIVCINTNGEEVD